MKGPPVIFIHFCTSAGSDSSHFTGMGLLLLHVAFGCWCCMLHLVVDVSCCIAMFDSDSSHATGRDAMCIVIPAATMVARVDADLTCGLFVARFFRMPSTKMHL